jgi:crotonobetainyl-CoA:carnitine CoA-transferase CaiB-like acyl-CoA transferase
MEASLPFIAPELYEASIAGEDSPLRGNRDPQMVPHGVYPAEGEDAWVALACRDDDDWRRLCAAIGRPDLATDGRFATADARRHHEDELDELIAAWTSRQQADATEATLRDHRVPAAAVLDHASGMADPQLVHRGHFLEVSHALHGSTLVTSTHMRFSKTPSSVRAAGPTIGQHSVEVLRTLLGYDDERIERLQAARAIGGPRR